MAKSAKVKGAVNFLPSCSIETTWKADFKFFFPFSSSALIHIFYSPSFCSLYFFIPTASFLSYILGEWK